MYTRQRSVKFLRGGGATFDLIESFMEDFRDIEETDDVAFLVANGLRIACVNIRAQGGKRVVSLLTKCLKCLDTISSSASVALVVSRVTIGLRVIIELTGVM